MFHPSRLLMILACIGTLAHADFEPDPHSYSQPEAIVIKHMDLDLLVDFKRQALEGYADLQLSRQQPEVDTLVLDTRDLLIRGVQAKVAEQWVKAEHSLGDTDAILGRPLRIKLPESSQRVRVEYTTQPQASGLQWLTPEQTAGKRQPFLFSQSQAIHARSWIPLQDTPQVRFTYAATVRTPKGLKAVMSAENDPADQDGEYTFNMPQPIPSYLLAIAVGELGFQAMSERTAVYAEPSMLKAAAAEFEDTEAMMQAVEKRYGSYRWGRYDLLILPPSFPFGGMENPRLSFITPTVIAGDKSLVALIAHELAHSWSGNLVTNAVWSDLWLNEGFTTYLEGRIIEDVFGERRSKMEAVLGYQDLLTVTETLPAADTRLTLDLAGRDPDEVFSNIAYEKGRWFLIWLEQRFGRQRFDAWLQSYFDRYAFQSIDTRLFKTELRDNLLNKYPGIVTLAEVETWLHAEGLPAERVVPESNAFTPIDTARGEWLAGERMLDSIATSAWTTQEWLYFLNQLPEDLGNKRMTALDQQFELTAAGNNEIAHIWLKLAIQNNYAPAFKRLETYLLGIGRRKLIVPLYEALMETTAGSEFARNVYSQARSGYHPLAQSTIDAIVVEESS